MTAENGNGELTQLVQIKRAYKKSVADLETELKTKYEQELSDGRRRLKGQYLENVVDAVFGESSPAPPAPKPEQFQAPAPAPAELESSKCPECDSPVDPMDKFCAECASPLKESENDEHPSMENYPVASASSQFRKRRRA